MLNLITKFLLYQKEQFEIIFDSQKQLFSDGNGKFENKNITISTKASKTQKPYNL